MRFARAISVHASVVKLYVVTVDIFRSHHFYCVLLHDAFAAFADCLACIAFADCLAFAAFPVFADCSQLLQISHTYALVAFLRVKWQFVQITIHININ